MKVRQWVRTLFTVLFVDPRAFWYSLAGIVLVVRSASLMAPTDRLALRLVRQAMFYRCLELPRWPTASTV
jgi:hypothetical protein